MDWRLLVLVGLVLLLAGCTSGPADKAAATKSPAKPPRSATVLATFSPTPAAGAATAVPLPLSGKFQAFERMRFGVDSAGGTLPGTTDFSLASDLGVYWDHPDVGPFNRQEIEKKPGVYDFSKADAYVAAAARNGFLVLGTIWPFADWDQRDCRPASCNAPDYGGLAGKRCLPCNDTSYQDFVRAVVRRYSDNGAELPVKYWQVASQPDLKGASKTLFSGNGAEYAQLMKLTFAAVKEACADCQVVFGGLSAVDANSTAFFDAFLKGGGNASFDVAAIYSENRAEDGHAANLRGLLADRNASKPFWLLGYGVGSGEFALRDEPAYQGYAISDEEQAQQLVRGIVRAFSSGASKAFYGVLQAEAGQTLERQSEALVTERGGRRAAFKAFHVLVQKLDGFSSVRRLAPSQYEFTLEGKRVFVAWGKSSDGLVPPITGRMKLTGLSGISSEVNASAVVLSNAPVFLEPLAG